MVARSVLKLDKGKNADCLVTIIPEQQHAFLYSNIVDSTFHQTNYCSRLQTIRWFRQSDRKPVGASFQTKKTQNICNLSLIPT